MAVFGSAYEHFKRALDRGDFEAAVARASALTSMSLADALELTILAASSGSKDFEPFAKRWIARLARERDRSLDEIAHAATLLADLEEGKGDALRTGTALAKLLPDPQYPRPWSTG